MRGEDRFRFGEGRPVDQMLVAALVLDPGVAHGPHVIGVLEQRGELRPRQRLFGPRRRRPGPQPALGQRRQERVDGVGAGAVGGEGPAHVRGALGIDLDRAEFAALNHLADVEVADGCAGRRAASLRLLDEPLLRLGRQVGRVELGIGGDDGVHEPADRRAVDVLGHRDQLDPGFVQRVGDRRVVVAVASEAIDLVDDHVIEVSLGLKPRQQLLQLRAVGGLRRLAPVGVLGDDLGIQLGRLRLARLALGRDRVALRLPAPGRLRGR